MVITVPLQNKYRKCKTKRKFTENARQIDRAGVDEKTGRPKKFISCRKI